MDRYAEGCSVDAGDIVAYIGQAGEEIRPDGATEPVSVAPQCPRSGDLPRPSPRGIAIRAAPMILNLAQRAGVDLAQVGGPVRVARSPARIYSRPKMPPTSPVFRQLSRHQ